MGILTLRADGAGLNIAPDCGGSIARYWHELAGRTIEWLRSARSEAIERRDPLDMSCFPLVPYSSLIRAGRFAFQSQQIALPLNYLPSRHTIHGHGWQRPWTVLRSDKTSATIEYRHQADEWPWSYRAEQHYDLSPEELTVRMSITNEGRSAMPAGLGPHPYFVRTPRARITAGADKIWLNDDELLPTDLVSPPPGLDIRQGIIPSATAMDHCFAAWDRRVVIEWPEWEAHLTMSADAPLNFLVVYTPPNENYFCVEPVSNVTDAFNMAAAGRTDTGMRILRPGESMIAQVNFAPQS